MGDAGPQQSTAGPTVKENEWIDGPNGTASQQKEINVLVTGFGPFKTFPRNPSWLIASSLPERLVVDIPENPSLSPTQSSPSTTLTIKLHVFPSQVPVSYAWVSSHIPTLLRPSLPSAKVASSLNATPPVSTAEQIPYDHVLHIGMAGGRNFYSLETLAHRDGYKIKDIEGKDGFKYGESIWRDPHFTPQGPAPVILEFAYDELDVWDRWVDDVTDGKMSPSRRRRTSKEHSLYTDRDANGDMDNPVPSPLSHRTPWAAPLRQTRPTSNINGSKRPDLDVDLRISHDPGRYLCDFIFYTSLAERLRQQQQQQQQQQRPAAITGDPTLSPQPESRVIFLHVPGDTDVRAIETGCRVAEGLIRAVVSSWESGARRNKNSSASPSAA